MLVDGDVFAYKASATVEVETDWGNDIWTLHGDFSTAKRILDDSLNKLQETLNADRMIIALTDGVNWRTKVLPTYKANRKDKRKPLVLRPIREYLLETRTTFLRDTLEGDDILGILATRKGYVKGEKVIVSIDKDMKTIPGLYYNDSKPELGIMDITEAAADWWHMYQTLIGDSCDGYSGCPGIGPKTAMQIIDDPLTFDGYKELWPLVVNTYKKKKLSEKEALTQARVARICRAEDFNFKERIVRLWNPPLM